MYHLPFAARLAHLGVPLEFSPYIQACYEGFPVLAEFIQGLLWRLTGSINATGVVNYVAFVLFLVVTWRNLGARLWLIVVLSLTAPLVLIHITTSYVDLFSNSFLAIGVTTFLAMLLFDRWYEKKLLVWALIGMTMAAWSKVTTLPVVALLFIALLVKSKSRRLVFAVLLLAFSPYLKNIVLYRNPTWPGSIPALKGYVPSVIDTGIMAASQRPGALFDASQMEIFFHSLFEIGHPTSYVDRERWTIDQGNADIAFRSGGFWAVGVITGALSAVLLGFLSSPRHGWTIAAAIVAMWCVTAPLPQSHELRYFQFIPLTVAAIIAMMVPRVSQRYPWTASAVMFLILAEFAWVTGVNQSYFKVEHVGYVDAAEFWEVRAYWKSLDPGKTYCAVGFEPAAFLLTGPTMHEFRIVDRRTQEQCPADTVLLKSE